MMNEWLVGGFISSSNRLISCSNTQYFLGGPGLITRNGFVTRTYYGLATHTIIYFGLGMSMTGTWQSSDTFYLQFDDRAPFSFTPGVGVAAHSTYTCGTSNDNMLLTSLGGKVYHTSNSITFKLSWTLPGSGSPTPALGIKDFSMSIATRQPSDLEEAYMALADTSIPGSTRCGGGQYWDTSTSTCKPCNAACHLCWGPAATQCYCPRWNGFYDGTRAYTTANTANCNTPYGMGTSQCLWCTKTYTLNPSGTCTASCTSPYMRYGDGVYHICLLQCTSSQFMSWNNTCFNACNPPLVAGTDSMGRTCSYPCALTINTFLSLNGSCASACPSNYTRIENHYQFCDYPCSPSQFAYPNSTCSSACSSPYQQRVDNTYKFCDYPCSSSQFAYANSTCSSACPSPYLQRVEGTNKFCDYPCSSSQFAYANSTCSSICPSSYLQRVEGTNRFCDYPCSSSQFVYANSTCSSICSSPYLQRVEGTNRFCDYPCSSSQFAYANSTCSSTCSSPYVQRIGGTDKFCDYPCPSSQFLYADGNCSLVCSLPYQQRVEGTNNFCDYPCSPSQFAYENGTCSPTCSSPYVQRIEGMNKFCDYLCPSSQFSYADGNCSLVCSLPYQQRVEGTNKFCDYPCSSGQFLYKNGNCSSVCSSPYLQRIASIYKFCDSPPTRDEATTGPVNDVIKNVIFVLIMFNTWIFASDPIAITGPHLVEILEYLRYVDVTHSARLDAMYLSFNPAPDMPGIQYLNMNSDMQRPFRNLPSTPKMFIRYGIPSSFLLNCWDDIAFLLIILGCILICIIFKLLVNKLGNTNRLLYFTKWTKVAAQNYLVARFYDCCTNFTLYGLLEFRVFNATHKSSFISFATGIFFLTLGLIIFSFHILLLKKYQILKRVAPIDQVKLQLEKFEKRYEGVKVLFAEFVDRSFIHQGFILFTTMRTLLYSILLTLLSGHQFAQGVMLILSSCIMLSYLVLKRPFEARFDFIQHMCFEVVIIMANVCILLLGILDITEGKIMTDNKEKVSNVVITINIVTAWILLVLLIIKAILNLRKLWKDYKRWRHLNTVHSFSASISRQPVIISKYSPNQNQSSSTRLHMAFNVEGDHLDSMRTLRRREPTKSNLIKINEINESRSTFSRSIVKSSIQSETLDLPNLRSRPIEETLSRITRRLRRQSRHRKMTFTP